MVRVLQHVLRGHVCILVCVICGSVPLGPGGTWSTRRRRRSQHGPGKAGEPGAVCPRGMCHTLFMLPLCARLTVLVLTAHRRGDRVGRKGDTRRQVLAGPGCRAPGRSGWCRCSMCSSGRGASLLLMADLLVICVRGPSTEVGLAWQGHARNGELFGILDSRLALAKSTASDDGLAAVRPCRCLVSGLRSSCGDSITNTLLCAAR